MRLTRHDIIGRAKQFSAAVCAASDFELSSGEPASEADILRSRHWSLYCLDFDQGVAIFVELPEESDLAAAPFMHMAQFDQAMRAIRVPLDRLGELAAEVELPAEVGIIFSTGRCGSTLASRILAQVPGVWSLSEPDAFTNIAFARFGLAPETIEELSAAVTRLCCRPPPGLPCDAVVLKPRSEAIALAPALGRALPATRGVFLYRDATGFVGSAYRFGQRIMGPEVFFGEADSWKHYWSFMTINAPLALLDDYFPDDADSVGHVDVITLGWYTKMRAHEAAAAAGARMTPIHYDDLNTDRRAQTVRLLEGLGISPDHADLAMKAFEKDAQAGSAGENAIAARPLDASGQARVEELLDRWGYALFKDERLAALA